MSCKCSQHATRRRISIEHGARVNQIIKLNQGGLGMNKLFIVQLRGTKVFGGYSNVAIIKSLDDLDKVRKSIKESKGLEFDELADFRFNGLSEFPNITDNRDIKLRVEVVDVVE